MLPKDKTDLFEFMLERVKETQKQHLEAEPQAFGRWFAKLYFLKPQDMFVSDGSRDGKIDLFFTTHNDKAVRHHVVNTKFTREYNKIAPPAFYEEMKYFWHAFENRASRAPYLEKAVKQELRPRYRQLFERYDEGAAELMFVTNHRRNNAHYEQVKNISIRIFHLDELIQYIVDDIDGAMPRTPPISLTGIHGGVLSPDKADTEVATSIVFARLIDFIRYMKEDEFGLLFMRNVRVPISIARSPVNREIQKTFQEYPREFAFSNNGITMLCEKQHYDPGEKVLTLDNPRVVNGSQTLHSICDVSDPSPNARVMVRIIEIEPPIGGSIDQKAARRKEVINKIAVRSNQQNPIKKWDLVSNDDFQLELFRFFRQKGYFYERRDREWNLRSRELRSVNIKQGIGIRWLTQLIASFYWSKPRLGPAVAKHSVGELFEGEIYDAIRKTPPELAFQLFLLDSNLWECENDLARKKVYIRNIKSHAHFVVFALAVKALNGAGANWGDSGLSNNFHEKWRHWDATYDHLWRGLTKACIDQIIEIYEKESRGFSRREGEELTYTNYFKNQGYISRILKLHLTGDIKRCARAILRS
jgi:hypothetical protein